VTTGAGALSVAGADGLKLTSYFGERQRAAAGQFTADALLDLYGQHSLAASVLLRGAEGFGARQRLRTDVSLTLSEDLPLIAVAVDRRERIEEVAGPTARLLRSGLVTLERAQLLSGDLSGARLPGEDAVAGADGAAYDETKLTVYLGRQERVYRMPAYMAVCDLLHRRGAAGATALLGVDGTVRGARERASFFSRNAATPMMVIAVGQGTLFGRILPELGGLLRQPLLTVEQVRICKRDGKLLCAPSALPAPIPRGCRCGTSSWSTPPSRRCTTGSRCTGRSSAGCAPRAWRARPRSAVSGDSTAITRPTATACCRPAGGSRWSRS